LIALTGFHRSGFTDLYGGTFLVDVVVLGNVVGIPLWRVFCHEVT
jgi:hypothetical protein